MAHGRKEFALVGYSEYLERRPLKFVDPIPASRICSACGIIPRITYTLLCGHTFCEPCYGSCVTTSECVCPLDGDVCDRDDVTRKEYPAEQLLRRQVYCWNQANGCGAILSASQIAEHIRHDCQHHLTRCPACSATVLSHGMCAHLKSRCTELVHHAAPGAEPRTDNNEQTHFMAFEKKMEERVRELDTKLGQMSLEIATHSDRLVELCHNNNMLKETLTQQLGNFSAQTHDRLNENKAEMKALVAHERTIEKQVRELGAKLAQISLETSSTSEKLIEIFHNNNHLKQALTRQVGQGQDCSSAEINAIYGENIESLMTSVTSVLASVSRDQGTHHWVLKGYAALKQMALKDGWSRGMSEKVYLRRYHISWGIHFKKRGDSLYLALSIQLHKGRQDDFLDWPFRNQLKLSIIHPETRQERHICAKPESSEANRSSYWKPTESSNTPIHFSKIESSDIEREGYVKSDELLLRFEMLLW
ncbi:uncharacterized protein LOC144137975 isoform X2 [Haemaphysalis longicornis]